MTHPNGTWGETQVVRWARENGFGHADRLTKTGSHDRGDVLLTLGLMVEVKVWKSASDRGPSPKLLEDWMEQTRIETVNGKHAMGFLIVKRSRTTDVGRWWAYLEARDLYWLLSPTGRDVRLEAPDAYSVPVSMAVADLFPILRIAGWGDQVE